MSSSAESRKTGSGFKPVELPLRGDESRHPDPASVGSTATGPSPTEAPRGSSTAPTLAEFERWVRELRDWFFKLPSVSRLVVLALAVVIGFSLMRTVLEIVTSFVSLALLLLVAYVVYKIFIAGDWPSDDRS